jgi:hypothetical protein
MFAWQLLQHGLLTSEQLEPTVNSHVDVQQASPLPVSHSSEPSTMRFPHTPAGGMEKHEPLELMTLAINVLLHDENR